MIRLLSINNLTVWFKTPFSLVKAVNGVNLSVEEKDKLALVGETGSGKTVLALSILALNASDRLIINGEMQYKEIRILQTLSNSKCSFDSEGNISNPNYYRAWLAKYEKRAKQLRQKEISIVFQEYHECLFPFYTIETQIRDILPYGFPHDCSHLLEILRTVHIKNPGEVLKCYPHQLNGGTIQRVLIAMSLISHPPLIIADEPTTALDATTQIEILELFKEIHATGKFTLVFITHSIEIAINYFNKIAVMFQGVIVELSSCENLTNPSIRHHPYTKLLIDPLGAKNNMCYNTNNNDGCVYFSRCTEYLSRSAEFKNRCELNAPPEIKNGETDERNYVRCWLWN